MSSKTKTTVTKEEAKPALVPKLRFPEFRGAEGWECGQLEGALSSISNGLVLEQSSDTSGFKVTRIETISAGTIDLAKVGLVKTSQDISAYKLRVGDILLSNINSVAHIGKSVFVDRDYDLYHGMNLLRLGVNRTKHDPQFIYYLINTDGIRESLRERANKAVNQASINQTELGKTAVALPLKPEQQKLAECLSSVDELMAAQARKVDALKTHKKGLMQQLFPREGETQPRLRFPEFQNEGEWEERAFSDLCDIKHGYPFESEFFSNEGVYVLLTPGSFYEEGGYRDRGDKQRYFTGEIPRDYVLAQGDMLVAMTEQAAGLLGSPLIVPASNKFLHNQRLGLIARKPGVAWSSEFFFHVFNTQRVRKAIHDTASGAKVRHTSPTKIGDVLVSVPSTLPEQERIASCLSSLDALITTETQKLEALKTHKKGLMQQLFPSPEEATP
jgi:type I restriction enzyme S subunit